MEQTEYRPIYTLESYLDEPEKIQLDSKTMRRYKRYMKKIVFRKTVRLKPSHFTGFSFEYDFTPKEKRVVLLSMNINNYCCDFIIPKGYVKGVYNYTLKKWDIIDNLKKGDRFSVDESLFRMYPTFFKAKEIYTLTDDIRIIYYKFDNKQDLLRLTKHILFQQIKMIYRYQNVSKKYKNH